MSRVDQHQPSFIDRAAATPTVPQTEAGHDLQFNMTQNKQVPGLTRYMIAIYEIMQPPVFPFLPPKSTLHRNSPVCRLLGTGT